MIFALRIFFRITRSPMAMPEPIMKLKPQSRALRVFAAPGAWVVSAEVIPCVTR